MPIYDFRCRDCGEVSEFLVPAATDGGTLACPRCGHKNLERLISAPNLLKDRASAPGKTCCGREERCEKPPCSTDKHCHKH